MKKLIINTLLLFIALFISCGTNETKVTEPVKKVKPETERFGRSYSRSSRKYNDGYAI